jgi:sulfate-transporting ATPase
MAKLYAFSIGAMIAALGGILVAFRNTSIVYSNIHAFDSVSVLGYAVIGGVGYVVGALIGGVLQPGGLGTNIGNLFGGSVQEYLPAIGGALLIITLITAQDGVAHLEARRWGRLLDRISTRARRLVRRTMVPLRAAVSTTHGSVAKVTPRTLRVDGLSVTFGGTRALNDLTLEIKSGEVLGLIGPNGAGKTTAIDAITGFVKPSSGRVLIDTEDLTRRSPRRRAEAAMSRSFQSLELFEDMTVIENLLVVSESRSSWSYLTDLFWPGKPKLSPAAQAAVELLDLADDLYRLPTELAIARAIAAEPSILLLDEPAAGLSQSQSAELCGLLRYLADERGMGVLLVEHDVELVMSSCDRVVALVFGSEIASGTPTEVRNNQHVIHAYLGQPDEANEAHIDRRDVDLAHTGPAVGTATVGDST